MTGAGALLHALRGMGVECIFASPGSDWAPLWEALAEEETLRYVSSRHEETAAAMALGYAKATGKLPAVVLHTTVGALHASMIVRAALHERIPMVVLAGESIGFGEPPGPALGRQWLRLLTDLGGPARLMEPCAKWSYALNHAGLLAHTMQRACQLAMAAPRGPVFVSVPTEFLMAPAGAPPPVAALAAPPAAGEGIEEFARMLAAAASPMIITEQAGKDPAAVAELVALAEALGAPVLEAWQPYYVNFPRSHPLYGGVVAEDMPQRLASADLVLLVEAVLPWHPPSAVQDKRVLVLGEDPFNERLPFWGFRADAVLAGEARASLRALRERLPAAARAQAVARLRAQHEAERQARRQAAQAAGGHSVIETRWVAHELAAVMPADGILVNETITHRLDLIRLLDRLQPGSFFEASYGGLGVGLGLALGVKHAHQARTVVCAIGDGAFHYNPVVASFGASQEHALPILVLLFNNAGYLSQKADVATYYPQGAAVRTRKFVGTSITPAPDYAALARAYGGYGEKVERPGEVRAALERGLDAVAKGRLALVDLVLEPV